MPNETFARPSLEIAREHVAVLLERFGALTGYPPTFVAKLARGEPKFARQFREKDFGFRSYDVVVSRMSALWPKGAEWPAEIPRQEPAKIEPEVFAEIEARAERLRAKGEQPTPATQADKDGPHHG